jgi:hypothetical protein
MAAKIVGLVIGSRKCGTTWLYENFLSDPDIAVSRKVKESGFFARPDDRDFSYYEGLFPEAPGRRVEVDSSLVYSNTAPQKIFEYNPEMKIALILRDPVEYAVSRFLHMQRKRQVSAADIVHTVTNDNVLHDELDYVSMLARFEAFRRRGSMLILPYGLLASDPVSFYRRAKLHLIGPSDSGFRPKSERVNVSRTSTWSGMSGLLSRAANSARKRRMHGLVNFAKGLTAHKRLEKQVDAREVAALRESVARAVNGQYGASVQLYGQIEREFVGHAH